MTYSSTVLADSPSGYWRLGDAAGPTATAAVGNNLAVDVNSPTFGAAGLLTGDSDLAMSFVAASSQRVAGSDTGLPIGNGTWSAEAWIKTTQAAEAVFINWGTAGTEQDASFGILSGALTFDSTSRFHSFGGTVNDNVRHHVVLTWDGTTMLAYKDGVQVGVGWLYPGAGGVLNLTLAGAKGMIIGRRSVRFYDGTLDEVAIYPTKLSATKVLAHYTAGITAPVTVTSGLHWAGRNFRRQPVNPYAIEADDEEVLLLVSAA
jgi:hypothetical protein